MLGLLLRFLSPASNRATWPSRALAQQTDKFSLSRIRRPCRRFPLEEKPQFVARSFRDVTEHRVRIRTNICIAHAPRICDYIVAHHYSAIAAQMIGVAEIPSNLGIKMPAVHPDQIERAFHFCREEKAVELKAGYVRHAGVPYLPLLELLKTGAVLAAISVSQQGIGRGQIKRYDLALRKNPCKQRRRFSVEGADLQDALNRMSLTKASKKQPMQRRHAATIVEAWLTQRSKVLI